MTKQILLRMLSEAGGVTTVYPFIETGHVQEMNELIGDGLLIRISGETGLAEVQITEKGRLLLAQDSTDT